MSANGQDTGLACSTFDLSVVSHRYDLHLIVAGRQTERVGTERFAVTAQQLLVELRITATFRTDIDVVIGVLAGVRPLNESTFQPAFGTLDVYGGVNAQTGAKNKGKNKEFFHAIKIFCVIFKIVVQNYIFLRAYMCKKKPNKDKIKKNRA